MLTKTGKSRKPFDWEQHSDYGDDWPEQRERCLRRDGYRCRTCRVSVKGTSKRAVHHIIERSKGGTNHVSNLKTECSDCHIKEHPHLQRLEAHKKKQAPKPVRQTFFGTPVSSKPKPKTFYAKKSRSLF